MTRLAGTRELLRLAWRRDRIIVPSSVLGLVLLSVGSAQATLALYPDDSSAAQGLAEIVANPAVLAMYGPISAASADALAVFKTVMMGAVLVSVLALVIVRRHTRTEEEEGRLELVGSGVVGRWAPLAAGVVVAVVAVVLSAVLSAAGLVGLGMDPAGSVAFGAAWLTAGLAQVGVTALAVQLAATTRGAGGLAFGFLGVAYVLRAAADASASDAVHTLGWLSPLGWAGRVEPYGLDRTWLVVLGVAVLVAGLGGALVVLERRDLGGGVLPTRVPGRTRARWPARPAPLGLVWRPDRPAGTGVGWVVGLRRPAGWCVGGLVGSVGRPGVGNPSRCSRRARRGSAGRRRHQRAGSIFLATETRVRRGGGGGGRGRRSALRLAAGGAHRARGEAGPRRRRPAALRLVPRRPRPWGSFAPDPSS